MWIYLSSELHSSSDDPYMTDSLTNLVALEFLFAINRVVLSFFFWFGLLNFTHAIVVAIHKCRIQTHELEGFLTRRKLLGKSRANQSVNQY